MRRRHRWRSAGASASRLISRWGSIPHATRPSSQCFCRRSVLSAWWPGSTPASTVGSDALAGLEAIRAALGAKLTLEIILPARDPDRELGDIAKAVAAAGLAVDAVVADRRLRPEDASIEQRTRGCRSTCRSRCRGAARISRRRDRRRRLHRLPRIQPQSAAGRSRFRHPHHQRDRACGGRPVGDADDRGAAACLFFGQGACRRPPLPHRPVGHRPAHQSGRIDDRRQSAGHPPRHGDRRSAPGRIVRRGVDARLRRRGGQGGRERNRTSRCRRPVRRRRRRRQPAAPCSMCCAVSRVCRALPCEAFPACRKGLPHSLPKRAADRSCGWRT